MVAGTSPRDPLAATAVGGSEGNFHWPVPPSPPPPAPSHAAGRPSETRVRELLDTVEAEHERQVRILRSELQRVQDELARALKAPAATLAAWQQPLQPLAASPPEQTLASADVHEVVRQVTDLTTGDSGYRFDDVASKVGSKAVGAPAEAAVPRPPAEEVPPEMEVEAAESARGEERKRSPLPSSTLPPEEQGADPTKRSTESNSSLMLLSPNDREASNEAGMLRATSASSDHIGPHQPSVSPSSQPSLLESTPQTWGEDLPTPQRAAKSVKSLRARKMARIATQKDRIAWVHKSKSFNWATKWVYDVFGGWCGFRSHKSLARQMSTVSVKIHQVKQQHTERYQVKILDSAWVRTLRCSVIMLNACFIGANTHSALRAEVDDTELSQTWEDIELAFTSWFTAELLVQIAVERLLFVIGDDRWWNLLDTFLVVSTWSSTLSPDSLTPGNLTVARLLRLFRFSRILRVLRVIRLFQNFRMMILSILHSFGTLVWVFIVLLFFLYFFAMIFMHGVTEYFRLVNTGDVIRDEAADRLEEFFGSLPVALLTLFEVITGGMDWHDIYLTILASGEAYALSLVVFIFFMVFLVLNVVVGGVVKTTSEVYKRDRMLVVQEERKKVQRYCEEIKVFFREADMDDSGTLTWEEFNDYLQDNKVQAYFQALELDISQAHHLFTLLDQDNNDEVGIDEFVDGCMHLKGQARSVDVNMLLYDIEKTLDKVDQFAEAVELAFRRLENRLPPDDGSKGHVVYPSPRWDLPKTKRLGNRRPSDACSADLPISPRVVSPTGSITGRDLKHS